MELNRAILKEAVERGVLESDQAEALWKLISERAQETPSFRFTHVLYYFGGMVAIGAMSLFMTLGFEKFGGWGLFAIAMAYAAAGPWFTGYLLRRLHLPIPAGIVGIFVVALVPLAVYGLQTAFGWWEHGRPYRDYPFHVDWRWVLMQAATLLAGVAMLWRYRLPLLMLPIALALWYISIDVTPILLDQADAAWQLRELVSLWFGLAMMLAAFWVDVRTRRHEDYGFWLYLVGAIAFWGGLSLTHLGNELHNFIYLCINVLMIVAGAMLARRIFVVLGVLGAAGYIGYLAYNVFQDSMVFPFVLTAIGFAIIYLGIVWQRREEAITDTLRRFLPVSLRELVERALTFGFTGLTCLKYSFAAFHTTRL